MDQHTLALDPIPLTLECIFVDSFSRSETTKWKKFFFLISFWFILWIVVFCFIFLFYFFSSNFYEFFLCARLHQCDRAHIWTTAQQWLHRSANFKFLFLFSFLFFSFWYYFSFFFFSFCYFRNVERQVQNWRRIRSQGKGGKKNMLRIWEHCEDLWRVPSFPKTSTNHHALIFSLLCRAIKIYPRICSIWAQTIEAHHIGPIFAYSDFFFFISIGLRISRV